MCSHTGAGTFDRVVSIEMIEAVGHEHLGSYFATIGHMLKPGGKAVIQAITYPDDRCVCMCVYVCVYVCVCGVICCTCNVNRGWPSSGTHYHN